MIVDRQSGELLLVLYGHQGPITAARFSPEGDLVLTACVDGSVRVWDAFSGMENRKWMLSNNKVYDVDWSPDSAYIAAGVEDGRAIIWDVQNKDQVFAVKRNNHAVLDVLFSKDGSQLITGAEDGSIRIWSSIFGKEEAHLNKHQSSVTSLDLSPDGKWLVSGSMDQTAIVWNLSSRTPHLTVKGHNKGIRTVAFHPGGQLIATGGDDGSFKLWSALKDQSSIQLKIENQGISSLAYIHQAGLIFIAGWDGSFALVDEQTHQIQFKWQQEDISITSAVINQANQELYLGRKNGSILVWQTNPPSEIKRFMGHADTIHALALSNGGKLLASGCAEGKVKVWDIKSGKNIHKWQAHSDSVHALAFSADNCLLATGGNENTEVRLSDKQASSLRLWNTKNFQESHRYSYVKEISSISFSPDGLFLLTTSSEDQTAKLWKIGKGVSEKSTLIQTFSGHTGSVLTGQFTNGGHRIVTGSSDKTVILWDRKTGKQILVLKGNEGAVEKIVNTPEFNLMTGCSDGILYIWPALNWNQSQDMLTQNKKNMWFQKCTNLLAVNPQTQNKFREYKIGMVHWAAYSPLNVAQVKGFWETEGVNVKVINFSENYKLNQALKNRSIHIALDMIGSWVGMNQEGLDLTILGETDWSHGGDKIIVKQGLNFSQMKGQTIGIYLNQPSVIFFLYQFLRLTDVKLSDINLLEISPEGLSNNFISNRLPVIVNYDPQALRAERRGNGVVVATSADFPGIIPEGFAMLTDIYQVTPKADLVRIIKAWFRAVEWIKQEDNWQEYANILNTHTFPGLIDYSDEDLKSMLASVKIHNTQTSLKNNSNNGELIHYLHDLKKFLINSGLIKNDFFPEKIFDNSIFTKALTDKKLLPEMKEEVVQSDASNAKKVPEKTTSKVRLTYSEWPPFISKNLPHLGPISQIVTEAFAQQGFQAEHIFFNTWTEAFEKAKMDEFDGSFIWAIAPERTKYFHFSEPVQYDVSVFFHKKDYPLEFNTFSDLKGIRIGACKGYFYGKEFHRAEKEKVIHVKKCDTEIELFQLLIKGRVDAIPINLMTGNDILRNHFSEAEQQQLTYHPNSIYSSGNSLMVSIDNPRRDQLINTFNQGLKHMKRNGRLKQIMEVLRTGKTAPALSGQNAANNSTHEHSQISSIKLASTNWPPFMGETLKNQGFLTEIVMEAFKEGGLLDVDVDFMSWNQAVEKSESGEYEALMAGYYSDERARKYLISTPIMDNQVAFFKLKGKTLPPAKTLEDSIPYSIGVVKGYVYYPEFDAHPELTKISAESDAKNIHNLLSGKVDLIIMDLILANYIVQKQFKAHQDALEQFGNSLSFQQLYVMFSKRNKLSSTLLKSFNEGLQRLNQNGKLRKILQDHEVENMVHIPESKTISVVSNIQIPFNGFAFNDKPGYLIEILKAIFETQGYQINSEHLTRDFDTWYKSQ